MQVLLRFVEARPAGQDQVGPLHQLRLALAQLRRRAGERRQLVHAVVDDRERLQPRQQRQGHRRVEPDDVLVDRCRRKQPATIGPQRRELVVGEAAELDRACAAGRSRRPLAGVISSLGAPPSCTGSSMKSTR